MMMMPKRREDYERSSARPTLTLTLTLKLTLTMTVTSGGSHHGRRFGAGTPPLVLSPDGPPRSTTPTSRALAAEWGAWVGAVTGYTTRIV